MNNKLEIMKKTKAFVGKCKSLLSDLFYKENKKLISENKLKANDYIKEAMVKISEFTEDYVDLEKIEELDISYKFMSNGEVRKNLSKKVGGYSNIGGNVIGMDYDDFNVIKIIMIHEGLHFVSSEVIKGKREKIEDGVEEIITSDIYLCGVSTTVFNLNNNNSDDYYIYSYKGLNEIITEYFTKVILGDDYVNYESKYFAGVMFLERLVKENILDIDLLKEAYFKHNPELIVSCLSDYFVENEIENLFNYLISDDVNVMLETYNNTNKVLDKRKSNLRRGQYFIVLVEFQ